MLADPLVSGTSSALDRALAGRNGPAPVAFFVHELAADQVRRALRHCLAADVGEQALRLVRTKFKPGRALTAEYDVLLPVPGCPRRISVTWAATGRTAPGPAAASEAEARWRGTLAPFHRAWAGSRDGRMSVLVAPVDSAFPQLVRLHDRAHLAGALRAIGDDPAPGELTVETVRYRPRQRHVLRVGRGTGRPGWYAKIGRDDAGRRAVEAAARAAAALDGAGAVSPVTGTWLAADHVAVWPEMTGTSLAQVIAGRRPDADDLVRATGAALRRLHDVPSPDGLPACPDAAGQAGETQRTAQVVDALLPAAGSELRREVGRALDLLAALPDEPPCLTHGDVKCDNVLVSGSGVHLLDFDRSGRGDPAADLGKFLADLRWWTGGDAGEAVRLQQIALSGYGVVDPARLRRARVYDGLLQLRMAARRVPVQDWDWPHRVSSAIGAAAATLAGEAAS